MKGVSKLLTGTVYLKLKYYCLITSFKIWTEILSCELQIK